MVQNSAGNIPSRPTAIDLFSGAGGMSLGFEQAGFDVVAAVDFDPVHAATHEYNFPYCPVICADAADVTGAELLSTARLKREELDVLFGGPPCQGFSIIGKRSSRDPRNRGLMHFHRLLDELRPRCFVLENVPGIASLGTHLERFIAQCRESGYNVVEPQILDAASYGVPQRRKRLFLYGLREGLRQPKYPAATHESRATRGQSLNGHGGLPHGPSVEEALGDLPDVEKIPHLRDHDAVRYKPSSGSSYARQLRGEELDPTDFGYERKYDRQLLTCSKCVKHSPACRTRFQATPAGTVEPRSRLPRLSLDGVASTLRAGTLPDRGSFMSPRPIHPTSPRCITVREAARLHSYPDWFRFHVTKWHGFRQIGNSVPPLLARAVARSVFETLRDQPTKPRHSIPVGSEWKLSIAFTKASVGISGRKPTGTNGRLTPSTAVFRS